MPKRRVARIDRLNPGDPLLIESRGRKSPVGDLPRLRPDQVAQISRTVRRVPEVVVKVSGGGRDGAAVKAHLRYIDRHGKLPLETDDGRTPEGKDSATGLVREWSLDALPRAPRRRDGKSAAPGRGPPKAVHNIVLSMPAKVDPDKVLAAARAFAREQFALAHRYAMVLHTDTRHPHVHLVVKAEREDGAGRLNIYKATLREWRAQFAACLRAQGLEANATSAVSRGRPRGQLKDRIGWAQRRASRQREQAGVGSVIGSTFLAGKVREVAAAVARGDGEALARGRDALLGTRASVDRTWASLASLLEADGQRELASAVREFAARLPAVRTDQERIADAIRVRRGAAQGAREHSVKTGEHGHERDAGTRAR